MENPNREPYGRCIAWVFKHTPSNTPTFKIASFEPFAGVFVSTPGPLGQSFFHIIDFGQTLFEPSAANFFEGWTDFSLPPGEYGLFIRGVPWLQPFTPGEYLVAPVPPARSP